MTRRDCHRGGFTLLELIAAMAIGILLLSFCMVTTGGAIRSCGEVEELAGVERRARRAFQQMVGDFSLAVSDAVVRYEAGGDDWRSDRVGFYCLLPEAQQSPGGAIGDLCAVMYGCRELVVGGRIESCLTRSVCDSGDVYRSIAQGRPGDAWKWQPTPDDVVATGVASFKVKRMVRGDGGKWREWTQADGEVVDGLEIGLVMLEPAMRRRMEQLEDAELLAWPGSLSAAERQPGFRVFRSLVLVGRHESE